MIAGDVLAISVSTMAFESAFSMGGRIVSPHCSRLHAKTVEALMCLQNWMIRETTKGIVNCLPFFLEISSTFSFKL